MSVDTLFQLLSSILATGYWILGIYLVRNDKYMLNLFFKMMDESSFWNWVVFWVILMFWPLKLLWNLLRYIINKRQEVK